MFETDSGNEHIFDANILITAHKVSVQIGRPPGIIPFDNFLNRRCSWFTPLEIGNEHVCI